MPMIAVVNESDADQSDVEFACKAVDAQLREDFIPRWPGLLYQPVMSFRRPGDIISAARGVTLICTIVDKIDSDTAAAYHSFAGIPLVKIGLGNRELSVLLSHEAIEETADPTCSLVVLGSDGLRRAREPADPTEDWTYPKTVELFGETRQVNVSAFVTERWFTGVGKGETFFCPPMDGNGLLPHQLAPGGYIPYMKDGAWHNDFSGTGAEMAARINRHAANETSRSSRRSLRAAP